MDPSIIEKFRNNFLAFLSGTLISGATIWSVADALHKKEVTILEREKGELQRQLAETEATLRTLAAIPRASTADACAHRKQDMELLIQGLDAEIKAKKAELARNAPVLVDGPKDEGYMRVEDELRSLQQQRDKARLLLIDVTSGKS